MQRDTDDGENPRQIRGRKIIVDDVVEDLVDVDAGAFGDEPARRRVEQHDDAERREQDPALDADAGQQPVQRTREALAHHAARAKSRASNATSSRGVAGEALHQPARDVDRSMAAAGAADADRQLRLAFGEIARQQIIEQVVDLCEERRERTDHLR